MKTSGKTAEYNYSIIIYCNSPKDSRGVVEDDSSI